MSDTLSTQPRVRFVGENLELNDGAVAKIHRAKFSFSSAQAQHGCRARFAFEKLAPTPVQPLQPNGLGSAAHSVFEQIMLLPKKQRTQKKAKELIRDHANKLIADTTLVASDYEKYRQAVEDMVIPLWKARDVHKISTIGTEVPIDTTIAGMPFIGFIDLVEQGENGVRLGDYKTGKIPNLKFGDKHADQLRLYSYLYTETTGRAVDSATLYYTAPDIPEEQRVRDVSLDPDECSRVVKDVHDMWQVHEQDMKAGNIPTQTGPLCSWCPACDVCPVAQRKGVKPDARFSGVRTASDLYIEEASSPIPRYDSATVEHKPDETVKTRRVFTEAKPWEKTPGYVNGAAYSTAGMFGYIDLAIEVCQRQGIETTRERISMLVDVFRWLVTGTQHKIATCDDENAGINTRLRGCLRSALNIHPLPASDDHEVWNTWARNVYNDMRFFSMLVAGAFKGVKPPFFLN